MSVPTLSHRLHNTILNNLERVKNAETVTRAALAELSRDLLVYVVESADIDMVNRLIGVLTPMNKGMSLAFFEHFLPHVMEKDPQGAFVRFGKRFDKVKRVKRKLQAIEEFLSDPSNTIWTWAGENVEIKKKQRDLSASLSKAVKEALEGKEESRGFEAAEPLSHEQVVKAILEGGVSVESLLNVVSSMANGDEMKIINPGEGTDVNPGEMKVINPSDDQSDS